MIDFPRNPQDNDNSKPPTTTTNNFPVYLGIYPCTGELINDHDHVAIMVNPVDCLRASIYFLEQLASGI